MENIFSYLPREYPSYSRSISKYYHSFFQQYLKTFPRSQRCKYIPNSQFILQSIYFIGRYQDTSLLLYMMQFKSSVPEIYRPDMLVLQAKFHRSERTKSFRMPSKQNTRFTCFSNKCFSTKKTTSSYNFEVLQREKGFGDHSHRGSAICTNAHTVFPGQNGGIQILCKTSYTSYLLVVSGNSSTIAPLSIKRKNTRSYVLALMFVLSSTCSAKDLQLFIFDKTLGSNRWTCLQFAYRSYCLKVGSYLCLMQQPLQTSQPFAGMLIKRPLQI
ncbi:hypothetical protein RF11_00394 [Thelohanellus kitauei]|uniref:Uncharacterized protein n=1 Tax=Thelohanellus kitauei TaxID=669202 RepID=A0A0C2N6M4_THEKT|nr:hypothetical protein RF11_00394 [Thelohanellus kitauei]